MKTATIVGAGLVGSLWAVYLSKAGYKVTIFERRTDIRKAEISAGKSINLSLSDRGWKALKTVNLDKNGRNIEEAPELSSDSLQTDKSLVEESRGNDDSIMSRQPLRKSRQDILKEMKENLEKEQEEK